VPALRVREVVVYERILVIGIPVNDLIGSVPLGLPEVVFVIEEHEASAGQAVHDLR
jgi:hypothetical protein